MRYIIMRYIKLLYLIIWVLIIQLPEKTVSIISKVILSLSILFFGYLILNQYFVIGKVQKLEYLPDHSRAMLTIKTPILEYQNLALIESLSLPVNLDENNWILGYGNQIEYIGNKPYLIMDKTRIISYPIPIEDDILKLLVNSFTVNKNIIIVIGINYMGHTSL